MKEKVKRLSFLYLVESIMQLHIYHFVITFGQFPFHIHRLRNRTRKMGTKIQISLLIHQTKVNRRKLLTQIQKTKMNGKRSMFYITCKKLCSILPSHGLVKVGLLLLVGKRLKKRRDDKDDEKKSSKKRLFD